MWARFCFAGSLCNCKVDFCIEQATLRAYVYVSKFLGIIMREKSAKLEVSSLQFTYFWAKTGLNTFELTSRKRFVKVWNFTWNHISWLTLLFKTTHVCLIEKKNRQFTFHYNFCEIIVKFILTEKMATALSSAYVLLGKSTMSDPPEWSTAVGAIHTLSSLLTCAGCHKAIADTPHGTPDDSFSLYCDKCQESSKQSECIYK